LILRWNVNKSFWIGILIIFAILCLSICSARAENEIIPPSGEGACYFTFNEQEARDIVMLNDQLNQCRGLATSEGFLIDEYNNKVLLMDEVQKNLESAILNCEKASEALKRIIEAQKAEQSLRMEKCLKDIEAAKPKLKDKLTWFGTGGVVGILIGMFLAL